MLWIGIALFLVLVIIIVGLLFKISSQTNFHLNAITNQISERLKEMSQSVGAMQKGVGERLDNTVNVVSGLHKSLGKLEETNRQIFEISKDISSLQNLLKAPKFRGEMGETLLGNLLEQVLPKGHYDLQYRFKTGETVDAVIRLGGNIVPIDAKFPLENFQLLLKAEELPLLAMLFY